MASSNEPELSASFAAAQDEADPLAGFAMDFHHPCAADGRRLIYLCGHSLGLQPTRAGAEVEQDMLDWRRLAVLGHHSAARPWIGYHERFAEPLAALVGADAGEVVAMNSLTVNLHLMMVSFFRPAGGRTCILIEQSAFPSDRYAVESQLRFHGLDPAAHLLEIGPRAGERTLRIEDLVAAIEREGPRLALVLLPGVQYLTGQNLDVAALAAAARRAGAAVGIDLAHSIGNIPLSLHDWNVDFAVWCSYKYLNAGPGAIGGCFVHRRHSRDPQLGRFAGWWGQNKRSRFDMGPRFDPIDGAEGWQLSNPPILSAAPLAASLGVFMRAGMERLRRKSLAQTHFMRRLLDAGAGAELEIITPAEDAVRGCQISLRLLRSPQEAKRCHERLTAAGVIGDWREPDILRLAPTPLYNSFGDVFAAAERLAAAIRA